MRYTINLVRTLRVEERQNEAKRAKVMMTTGICFGVLLLALFFCLLQTMIMFGTLSAEKDKLSRIEAEYKRYKATAMFVNKADVELLDHLQNGRIFWTKKLVAMASHLPENYWITDVSYGQTLFNVKGYGYITDKQKQLVTIDDYLNMLRADNAFSDVFKTVYLNSTERKDEQTRERVSFDYSATAAARQ